MAHKKSRNFENESRISRAEARARGLKRYFTGVSCMKGHVAPRYSANCKCVICAADDALSYQKKMYAERPDEFRQRVRDGQKRNLASYIFRGTKSRARKRGIEFTITLADVPVPRDCPCCGRELQLRTGPIKKGPNAASPSIDRINPARGYIPGNVSVICWRCNELKRDATIAELRTILSWLERNCLPVVAVSRTSSTPLTLIRSA
jgi:hypothetical protein